MPTVTPAHFNVNVTFGTPTFAHLIHPAHFNVEVQFRQPAVYTVSTQRPWVFLIAGVDRTTSVQNSENPVSVRFQLGSIPQCNFSIVSEDATYRPTRGQDFVLIESATGQRVFGGTIQTTQEICPAGTAAIKVGCTAVGYANKLEERRVGAYYEYSGIIYSPASLFADMLRYDIPGTGITMKSFAGGGNYGEDNHLFQWVTGLQSAKQIADQWGLEFFVDEYGRAEFIEPSTGSGAAPFNIAQGDGNLDASDSIGPRIRRDATRYANRILVRNDLRQPGEWTDTHVGDEGVGPNSNFYFTKYILNTKPNVYVNGTLATVGEFGTGSFDFTFVFGLYGVQGYTAYTSGDTVEIKYKIPLQPVYRAEDAAEIASFGRVVEILYDVRDIQSDDEGNLLAAGLLEKHVRQPYTIEYATQRSGLKPGMLQNVNLTLPLVPNLDLLIDSVSATFEPTIEGGFFRWNITATNGAPQGEKDIVRLLQRIRARIEQPTDRHRQIFPWNLALTVHGLVNPGQHPHANSADTDPAFAVSPFPLGGSHVIVRAGYIAAVRCRYDDPPLTETVQIDVLLNNVSIFPGLGSPAVQEYLEVPPSTASPVVPVSVEVFRFRINPLRVEPGDILRAEVITGDEDAKDGILEVEQQG